MGRRRPGAARRGHRADGPGQRRAARARPSGTGSWSCARCTASRGAIAELAAAIQRGRRRRRDGRARAGELRTCSGSRSDAPVAALAPEGLPEVRSLAVECGRAVIEAARGRRREGRSRRPRAGSACCARTAGGPTAWRTWMRHVESWLRAEVEGFAAGDDWYVGRPAHRDGERLRAEALQRRHRRGRGRGTADGWPPSSAGRTSSAVSPARLAAVDTVYAMTVHKSQGSQFHTVAFLVPSVESQGPDA